jgi:hypothetical protein
MTVREEQREQYISGMERQLRKIGEDRENERIRREETWESKLRELEKEKD